MVSLMGGLNKVLKSMSLKHVNLKSYITEVFPHGLPLRVPPSLLSPSPHTVGRVWHARLTGSCSKDQYSWGLACIFALHAWYNEKSSFSHVSLQTITWLLAMVFTVIYKSFKTQTAWRQLIQNPESLRSAVTTCYYSKFSLDTQQPSKIYCWQKC